MRTQRTLGAMLTLAYMASVGGVAAAHHSQTGFDPNETPVELKGTVAEYRWRNPHILLFWDVKDQNGTVVRWVAEFASIATSIGRGMSKDTFKVGEEITATCIRAKAGTPVCASIKKLVKADGRAVAAPVD